MDNGRPFVLRQQAQGIENNMYSLYRFPYNYTLEKDNVQLRNETRYRVLVFRKGENSGDFYLDDSVGNISQRVNVDSFLKQTMFNRTDIYNPDFFSLSRTKKNAQEMTQFFIPKRKTHSSDCDSVVVYYSKQAVGIGYSLSKILDTSSEYKLYKVNIICQGYYSEKYKLNVPKRIISLELKKDQKVDLTDNVYFLRYVQRLNGEK